MIYNWSLLSPCPNDAGPFFSCNCIVCMQINFSEVLQNLFCEVVSFQILFIFSSCFKLLFQILALVLSVWLSFPIVKPKLKTFYSNSMFWKKGGVMAHMVVITYKGESKCLLYYRHKLGLKYWFNAIQLSKII